MTLSLVVFCFFFLIEACLNFESNILNRTPDIHLYQLVAVCGLRYDRELCAYTSAQLIMTMILV
jgi:hypothetical protein